ncbi:MAG: Sapep family Mn(2+)-dependent dipeptidase [Clostridia bacterium]|nr:Sapep family Mn(2+)-dependent dipeptidase [Clostridia bacterium]
MYQKQIHEYIWSHKEEMTELLKKLVSFPSVQQNVSPEYPFGKECAEVLDYVKELYESNGFETEAYPKDGYLLSYFGNHDTSLGLFAHADVVAAGDDWVAGSPFSATEKDGFLIGRGVSDDKCAVVTSLYIMKMIKELKLPIKSRIVSFTGISEETGMQDIETYAKNHKAPDFSLICDSEFPLYRGNKGMFQATATSKTAFTDILDFHGGTSFNIILGKATVTLKEKDGLYEALKEKETDSVTVSKENGTIVLYAEGLSTHGAFPEGSLNAGFLLADILSECEVLSQADREQMQFIKNLLGTSYGEALSIESVDPDFGKLTCTNGIARVKDGFISLVFDIRFGSTTDPEALKQDLLTKFGEKGWEVSFSHTMATHVIPEHLPLVQACLAVYKAYTGDTEAKTLVNAGGTYGRHLPCAVEIGTMVRKEIPFSLPKGHGNLHQPDELLSIEGFLEATEIAMLMLLECDKLL